MQNYNIQVFERNIISILKTPKLLINGCQYDIHLFVKKGVEHKRRYIGKWVVNKTDKDQLHDSSELEALFKIDLKNLKENGSDSDFRGRCSEQCNTGYVKV